MCVGALIKRGLEVLAASGLFSILILGPLLGLFAAIYLVLFSSYRLYVLLYLTWIFIYDLHTCDRGGRRLEWVRCLPWFKYVKNYFPLSLKKADGVNLDPKKNYMLCCFPHGIFPIATFLTFATEGNGFRETFPNFTPYGVTLRINFLCPFYREFLQSLGICAASAKSIKWLLSKKDGGNFVAISVGGAAEALYNKPRDYTLVLKNRMGFVKLALKTGTPLVPVLSFGETDLVDQVENPKGSLLRSFQEWVKKHMGYAPVLPKSLVPKKKPVTTLVGFPLHVERNENPSVEEIRTIHEKFINHLVEFFEAHKHKYIDNADEIKLVIA